MVGRSGKGGVLGAGVVAWGAPGAEAGGVPAGAAGAMPVAAAGPRVTAEVASPACEAGLDSPSGGEDALDRPSAAGSAAGRLTGFRGMTACLWAFFETRGRALTGLAAGLAFVVVARPFRFGR